MRLLRRAALLSLVIVLSTSAGASAGPRFGAAEHVSQHFSYAAATVGDAQHLPALVTAPRGLERVVLHQDGAGTWQRFSLGRPGTAELAMLEDGTELAAYDDRASTVWVRTWRPDGAVGPAVPVLTGVLTESGGETGAPPWKLEADREGTVIVASGGDRAHAGAVVVTVRDPGGSFSVQRELAPADPAAIDEPRITLSPVSADGTVTVDWPVRAAGGGPDRQLSATRTGRAPVFGPVGAPPPPAKGTVRGLSRFDLAAVPPGRSSVTTYANGSQPVRVGAGILRLCRAGPWGCSEPQLTTWAQGPPALAFNVLGCPLCGAGDYETWWVARARADGTFADPVRVTRAPDTPVGTSRPGVLAFPRADPGTGDLLLLPFGGVPAPPPPHPALLHGAGAHKGRLTVTARCRDACRLDVTVRVLHGRRPGPAHPARVDLRGFGGPANRSGSVEALEPAWLSVASALTGSSRRLVVVVTARDAEGRTAQTTRTLRRGRLVGLTRAWCLVGVPPARYERGC